MDKATKENETQNEYFYFGFSYSIFDIIIASVGSGGLAFYLLP
jgi:hypothetical protein